MSIIRERGEILEIFSWEHFYAKVSVSLYFHDKLYSPHMLCREIGKTEGAKANRYRHTGLRSTRITNRFNLNKNACLFTHSSPLRKKNHIFLYMRRWDGIKNRNSSTSGNSMSNLVHLSPSLLLCKRTLLCPIEYCQKRILYAFILFLYLWM